MFKWSIEFKKHQLVGIALLLWSIIALITYTTVNNSLTDIVWIFSVLLISAAAITYCGVILFQFIVLKRDMLLQLSDLTERAKTYLKTLPLLAGLLIISLITLSGYLFADSTSHGTINEYLLTYGAKILSILSFISLAWLCAKAANFAPKFKISVFVALLLIVMIIYVLISWHLYGFTENNWYVTSTSEFVGFPVYLNIVPVILTDPSLSFTQLTAISAGLNLIPILLFVCFSFVQRK